ncbi:putative membrane protein [Arthrobacter bambusae]|uniref:Membrane protein n=1 Tax=Arthrobacter bambusae TaxID=1338426 RepID=A0ABV2P6S4_9MICC
MKRWLLSYALAAVIFAVIDVVWIVTVAQRQYESQIGHLLASSPQPVGAVLFYVVFVAGIVHYGVRPRRADLTLGRRVAGGALFGFFTYSTWALTALAVLKDFPLMVAVTDIAWGIGVSAVVTWLTALIGTVRGRV